MLKCQFCNNQIKFMVIHSNSYQYSNSNLVIVWQNYFHFWMLSPEVNLTFIRLTVFLGITWSPSHFLLGTGKKAPWQPTSANSKSTPRLCTSMAQLSVLWGDSREVNQEGMVQKRPAKTSLGLFASQVSD